jgi:hypothetical protein
MDKEGFEKLIETSPKEALKYVKEFQETVFWEYFRAWMDNTFGTLFQELYDCKEGGGDKIRGKISAFSVIGAFPDTTIEALKDNIALQKEAVKVEEARKPEGNKE